MLAGRKNIASIQAIGLAAGVRQRIADGLGLAPWIGEEEGETVTADAEELRGFVQARQPFAQHFQNGSVAAGIAQAGMNGLETVHIQKRQQRAAKALAQPVQRLHQRHPVAQPRQAIARQGRIALAPGFGLRKFRFLALGDVAEIRPRQSDGTSCSLTMVARSSSQRQDPLAPRTRNSSRKACPG